MNRNEQINRDTVHGVAKIFANRGLASSDFRRPGGDICLATYGDDFQTVVTPSHGQIAKRSYTDRLNDLLKISDPNMIVDYVCGAECCGGGERPYLIVDWAYEIDDGKLFWEVMRKVWSKLDHVPFLCFGEIFADFDHALEPCEVPDRLTVYRGQEASAMVGYSWTTDLAVAETYAAGARYPHQFPLVLAREVRREDVAFVTDDRSESTVVLLDPEE